MKLKLTIYGHIKMLSMLIILSTLLVVFLVYFKISHQLILMIVIPYVILFVLPVAYIHYNYYQANKGIEYIFNNLNIIKKSSFQEIIYKKEDVLEIKAYMTANRSSMSSFRNFPYEDYYYIIIRFKDKKEFVLTSLLSDSIYDMLHKNLDILPVKIKTFYPIIHNY